MGVGAASGVDFGLSDGLSSVDLGGSPPPPERCGECHLEEYTDWAASRHRASWSNDLIVAGYAVEPLSICVNCHAPLPEQATEIAVNHLWYRSLDPHSRVPSGSVVRQPEPHADQGITCAVCHWRDGSVLAELETGVAPHQVEATASLGNGELCVECHEFGVPVTVDGKTHMRDELMQSTASEWRAWQAAGGTDSCEDCHMPGGRHLFRGVHDRQWLRESVSVDVTRDGDDAVFTVRSVGVGHQLPSGDLYRNMTLEGAANCESAPYAVLDHMGHRFETRLNDDGHAYKTRSQDTTLRPGGQRQVRVPADQVVCWKLVWHDGSPQDEARGLLDPNAIVEVLVQGVSP